MMRWWRAIGDYSNSADPRGRVANLVALCIVGNQPLYPIYVAWVLGHWDWWVLATWLTTPFFASVPWLGRRDRRAGKLLLCAAGTGNTALAVMVLGRASGVGLFFIPCAMLCLLLVRGWAGWVAALIVAVIAVVVDAIARVSLPQLFRLNAFSVISLCCFIAFLIYRARKQEMIDTG